MKDGSKDVVREVKRVGEAITGKVTNATGNVRSLSLSRNSNNRLRN